MYKSYRHMNRIFLTLIGLFFINLTFGQHLYPEKFEGCNTNRFCLDCGDTKAEPPTDFGNELITNLNSKSLMKINGTIEVQILIDTVGNPCLLSAKNSSNVKSKKLKLQYGINNTSKWTPAISEGKPTQSSVSLLITFKDGRYSLQRRTFDFSKNTNFKSVGTPDVKGSKAKDLSVEWIVFNQSNSDIPWDMSRSIATDSNNNIWVSTDNGIVKISGGRDDRFQF
jgi:hypothetical protein